MITVGQPGPGAIGVPCMLRSATRAAGKPPMVTVMLPIAIPFGAGETQAIPPGIDVGDGRRHPADQYGRHRGGRSDRSADVRLEHVDQRAEGHVARPQGRSGRHPATSTSSRHL